MSSEKKGGGKIDEHTNKEKLIKGRVLIKKRGKNTQSNLTKIMKTVKLSRARKHKFIKNIK
jgi:hypothetical protein